MSVLPLYHWDFDRVPTDYDPAFLTISVAIFQWLPRSSGKGLKKVNGCRVHGYQIERHKVYAKAQEICDRLNGERASALNRPKWLQKQYSVPRPATMPLLRRADRLSPGTIRSIRERVMKRELFPLGFIKSSHASYVRKQGNQIHLVYFDKYDGQYTLQLGFHYEFLFPHFAWKRIHLNKYHFLDCALHADVGKFHAKGFVGRIDYGSDPRQLGATLIQNIGTTLKVFARYEGKWANAESWLKLFDSSSGELPRSIGKWVLNDPHEFFAGVAMECGRWQLAERAIDALLAQDCAPAARKHQAKVAKCLRQRMSKLRRNR
jgi:hypothetical protein